MGSGRIRTIRPEATSPTIITCCDDTGLAFRTDAVEAQSTYWGDGGGTDPNCGRLYNCGPTVAPGPGPVTDAASIPTDKDAKILRALEYIDRYVPPEQKNRAYANLINALPPEYRDRAVRLLVQFKKGNPVYLSAVASGAPASGAFVSSGTATAGRTNPLQQYIWVRAGEPIDDHRPGRRELQDNPITQSAAQAIVGTYGSVPGGVTLEGTSPDLSGIKTVMYEPRANAFIINEDIVYLSPVSPDEFSDIARAIATDDRIGVSQVMANMIVLGGLPQQSTVATTCFSPMVSWPIS